MNYLKQTTQYKDRNPRQHRMGLTSEVLHQSRHPVTNRQAHKTDVTVYNQAMYTTVSQLHRIILANQPRLLREMLGHVFAATPGLQVVAEIDDPAHLPAALAQAEVHWLIVTLDDGNWLPPEVDGQTEETATPSSLMAISPDGRQIEVQKTTTEGDRQTYALYDISLANLLSILS
jgi:hypothetical protein